jgi:hypothetical protein
MSNELNLTPAQQQIVEDVKKEFLKYNLDTTQEKHADAEEAIKRLYKYEKRKEADDLVFMWVKNPIQGAKLAAYFHLEKNKNMSKEELQQAYQDYLDGKLKGFKNINANHAKEQTSSASYGSFESYWVAVYHAVKNVIQGENNELIHILVNIVKKCGVFWRFDKGVILCNKPLEIHTLNNERLHNDKGPALVYPGLKMHFYKGEFKNSLLDLMMANKINLEKSSNE